MIGITPRGKAVRRTFDAGEHGEVEITFDYSPGDRGCHTMSNGDPGWPASGPDCDPQSPAILHKPDGTKEEINLDVVPELTGKTWDQLCESAIEETENDMDRAEYEADSRWDEGDDNGRYEP